MKCPACGWTNPRKFTSCFKCKSPLRNHTGVTAPRPFPEQTHGDVFAGSVSEAISTIVDFAVSAALAAGIFYWLATEGGPNVSALVLIAAAALPAILLPAFLDNWAGGSIGCRLSGMHVVGANGKAPSILRSLLRTLLKFALNSMLPLVLSLLEILLFEPHSLHGLISGTYSVKRGAPPQAAADAIRTSGANARFRWLVRIAGTLAALAATGAAALVIWVSNAPANPKRAALHGLAKSGHGITLLAGNYWTSHDGKFAASAGDLGLQSPPQGFAGMSFNAANGQIVLTPSDPLLQSVQLVFFPELQDKAGRPRIRKWRCGAPGLDSGDRPFNCNSPVPGL